MMGWQPCHANWVNCHELSKTVQNCSETVMAVLAVLPTIPVLGVMCAMHGMRGMPRAPDVHGNHGTHATCGICVMVASPLKPLHRDTAHAGCVIRTDFHGTGHPTLSLVTSRCVGVWGFPVTRQKRKGGCPPKMHPWESPDRAAERENVQTRRRAATKKNSDVDHLF